MKRKWWMLIGLLCLAAILVWYLSSVVDFDQLVARERRLKDWIEDRPWTAGAIGLVAYTLLTLVPGTGGKSLVFGWLFGFWSGLVQVNLGLTLAALITFSFSRYFFQQTVRNRFPKQVEWLNRTLASEGPYVVLTMRLAHVPYSLVNYALGATSLSTFTFWWTSQLGMLPGNALFVYAGSQLPSLDRVASGGADAVLLPEVLVPLLLLACLPLLLRIAFKRRDGQEME